MYCPDAHKNQHIQFFLLKMRHIYLFGLCWTGWLSYVSFSDTLTAVPPRNKFAIEGSKQKEWNHENNPEGRVFLSLGARSHLEIESRSMGETVFVSSVHSQCHPVLKKPPAPTVSTPGSRHTTTLEFKVAQAGAFLYGQPCQLESKDVLLEHFQL